MKVLLINGSSRKECTYTALSKVAESLNEEGIEQAKELAKMIDLSKIDICICSPLKRAKETTELIVGNKKKIIYDELLLERECVLKMEMLDVYLMMIS